LKNSIFIFCKDSWNDEQDCYVTEHASGTYTLEKRQEYLSIILLCISSRPRCLVKH